ncbi:MAG: hypothetical protein JWM70_606 [Microbacteriaceae bacterium]|nr:hypothetical protein [Microbacteriaceae bacterium]
MTGHGINWGISQVPERVAPPRRTVGNILWQSSIPATPEYL